MIRKGQMPILIFSLIWLIVASTFFIGAKNYEFLLYILVVVGIGLAVLVSNKKMKYPNTFLWGLSIWGLLHMLGGGYRINGDVLYNLMIFPFNSHVFKFDQLVHIFGFGVTTLFMWHILQSSLKKVHWIPISIVVIMAGIGAGAINEIVEFIAVVLVPNTNVGGYVNTSLDMISNLIGACIAMVYIKFKHGKIK